MMLGLLFLIRPAQTVCISSAPRFEPGTINENATPLIFKITALHATGDKANSTYFRGRL